MRKTTKRWALRVSAIVVMCAIALFLATWKVGAQGGFMIPELGFAPSANAGVDNCVGSSALHFIQCSYNGGPAHPLRLSEAGTCTMASGACTFTWPTAFASTPLCVGSWNGSGTLTTGATLKVACNLTNAVATSSTGSDTATIEIIGLGNPN